MERFNKNPHKKLRIVPISGLEFIGANCTAIEYGDEIIIVDAGLGFPSLEHLGVDFIIPNSAYMRQNASKIKALIITHGHQDHIGAIPYLLEPMGFAPIYASEFAKELIAHKLKNDFVDIYTKTTIHNVDRKSKLRIGAFDITFFGVNHSIPESMGLIIRTPAGTIVHTGDFKFDNSPVNEPHTEYAKIANVGSQGVLCLLSDSTNSYREGHSLSESEIGKKLENVIADVPGRVIVATFASMVNRIIELLKIAQKYNKKVFVSGRSMQLAIDIAVKIGYVKIPRELFIKANEFKNYKDSRIMVLATGTQGEALAALSRMARNEHRDVKVQKGDTVIMSASTIPGNGSLVQELIDNLTRNGANVYHNEIMNLHTTGHGHKEEQKLMINLVQPKYFIPIHGFQSHLAEHAKTAVQLGVAKKNVIIAEDGDMIEISKFKWEKIGKVTATPVNVSGSVVGDIGDAILDERQQLANYGVVVYGLAINKTTRQLLKDPEIRTSGFIYVKGSQELVSGAIAKINEVYSRNIGKEINIVANEVNQTLKKYFYEKTQREPMILNMINEF